MSRALHPLLTTKLLPMHVNDDHSELANALILACIEACIEAELPNGYELLYVLLRHLIPAFNKDKVTIDWPAYSEFEDIFLCASAVELEAMTNLHGKECCIAISGWHRCRGSTSLPSSSLHSKDCRQRSGPQWPAAITCRELESNLLCR
jgi:hypothetical protein